MFLSAGCSLLEAQGFSCNLNVHLGINKLQLCIENLGFYSCKILQFMVIKTLDPELYPDPQ
jgi:hypothetical protein